MSDAGKSAAFGRTLGIAYEKGMIPNALATIQHDTIFTNVALK